MGGRPFSGKAKKAQLQAKRVKKQQRIQAEENPEKTVFVKKSEITSKEGRTTRKGELIKNEKRSVFRKEERAEVDKRKKAAMQEYTTRRFTHGVEFERWWNIEGDSLVEPPRSLQIPKRPQWGTSDTEQSIETRENMYFSNYLEIIDKEYGHSNLNLFERNLEVWRQLWRVCESSHVVAIIADARHPLFHIPSSLIAFLRDINKPIMIVLNKIDLVPQASVDAWMEYLTKLHPTIPIIPFTCHPNLETVTLELNDNRYRKRRLRDSKTKVNYNLYINDLNTGEETDYQEQETSSDSDNTHNHKVINTTDDDLSQLSDNSSKKPKRRRRQKKGSHGKQNKAISDTEDALSQISKTTKESESDSNVKSKHGKCNEKATSGKKHSNESENDDKASKRKRGGRRKGRHTKHQNNNNNNNNNNNDDNEQEITLSSVHKALCEETPDTNPKSRHRRKKKEKPSNPPHDDNDKDITLSSVHEFLHNDGIEAIDPVVNFKGMNKGDDDDEPARKKNQPPRRKRYNKPSSRNSSDSEESIHEAFKGQKKAISSELRSLPENAERLKVAAMIKTLLETAKSLTNIKDGERVMLGTVGHPNVGKSSFINSLKGEKVVSTSATAGHTKHLQHIPLNNEITLCDCPGLTFPVVGLPLCIQVLMGSFPLAQNREPYTAIHYLGERIPMERVYNLSRPRCALEDEGWSGYSLCEAFSEKSGFYLKRGKGLPDTHRGGQGLIKEAVNGILILFFMPPPLMKASEPQQVLRLSHEPSFEAPTLIGSSELESEKSEMGDEGIGGSDSDAETCSTDD